MTLQIRSVSFIGSGNLAWHLSQELHRHGIRIGQVFSRNAAHAAALAERVSAVPVNDLRNLEPSSDLYIISVSDDAIPGIISGFPFADLPVVHTAGSVSAALLSEKFRDYGVIYPVQAFRKEAPIEWTGVPFCIEAGNKTLENALETMVRLISEHITPIDSIQRARLHLAAVFASNFSNAACTMAAELLGTGGMDFSLLRPLIRSTLGRLDHMTPFEAQTGPARRHDLGTLEKHMELLKEKPEMEEIYRLLSRYIRDRYPSE